MAIVKKLDIKCATNEQNPIGLIVSWSAHACTQLMLRKPWQ